uniref:Uncharacterized protein n=1 Tax=Arundo donax TaxID=35708 RepID=A0A0A9GRT6_ARUDO
MSRLTSSNTSCYSFHLLSSSHKCCNALGSVLCLVISIYKCSTTCSSNCKFKDLLVLDQSNHIVCLILG